MRRFFSVLLFVLGGWMLLGEMMIVFTDAEPGPSDNLIMLGAGAIVAGVPLLLGAAVSPGNRWRELGLTLLICVGLALFTGLSAAAVFFDQALMKYMPPTPELANIRTNPLLGIANLLVVGALGWWLYRREDFEPS